MKRKISKVKIGEIPEEFFDTPDEPSYHRVPKCEWCKEMMELKAVFSEPFDDDPISTYTRMFFQCKRCMDYVIEYN